MSNREKKRIEDNAQAAREFLMGLVDSKDKSKMQHAIEAIADEAAYKEANRCEQH